MVFGFRTVFAGAVNVFRALDINNNGLVSVATMLPGFVPPPLRIRTTVVLPDTSPNLISTDEIV